MSSNCNTHHVYTKHTAMQSMLSVLIGCALSVLSVLIGCALQDSPRTSLAEAQVCAPSVGAKSSLLHLRVGEPRLVSQKLDLGNRVPTIEAPAHVPSHYPLLCSAPSTSDTSLLTWRTLYSTAATTVGHPAITHRSIHASRSTLDRMIHFN